MDRRARPSRTSPRARGVASRWALAVAVALGVAPAVAAEAAPGPSRPKPERGEDAAPDPPAPDPPAPDPTAPDPDDDFEPATSPEPTPWALAGARNWLDCHDAERLASARMRGANPRDGGVADELVWARRAAECPQAPSVLTLAAQLEIIEGADRIAGVENWDSEGTQLDEVATEHVERIGRALAWLDSALAESSRRGTRAPPEARYYRAYALTTLGRMDDAAQALRDAERLGDVARYRLQRMSALVHLFRGDLQRALALSHQALVDAPSDDQAISRYMYALVLDRVGASHFSALELHTLHRSSDRHRARIAVESVLPIHERLFLRAIDHQAKGERSHATRLWAAYLSRPEPEEAERVLAERHRAELEPRPPLVAGPKQ